MYVTLDIIDKQHYQTYVRSEAEAPKYYTYDI